EAPGCGQADAAGPAGDDGDAAGNEGGMLRHGDAPICSARLSTRARASASYSASRSAQAARSSPMRLQAAGSCWPANMVALSTPAGGPLPEGAATPIEVTPRRKQPSSIAQPCARASSTEAT